MERSPAMPLVTQAPSIIVGMDVPSVDTIGAPYKGHSYQNIGHVCMRTQLWKAGMIHKLV